MSRISHLTSHTASCGITVLRFSPAQRTVLVCVWVLLEPEPTDFAPLVRLREVNGFPALGTEGGLAREALAFIQQAGEEEQLDDDEGYQYS